MMEMVFLRECLSRMPQKREVSTEAPMPIPIQQIINRLINCPARDEAESWSSPMELSITVSIKLIPTVINDCKEIGIAIFAILK